MHIHPARSLNRSLIWEENRARWLEEEERLFRALIVELGDVVAVVVYQL
jgi:hypothetical protein